MIKISKQLPNQMLEFEWLLDLFLDWKPWALLNEAGGADHGTSKSYDGHKEFLI